MHFKGGCFCHEITYSIVSDRRGGLNNRVELGQKTFRGTTSTYSIF